MLCLAECLLTHRQLWQSTANNFAAAARRRLWQYRCVTDAAVSLCDVKATMALLVRSLHLSKLLLCTVTPLRLAFTRQGETSDCASASSSYTMNNENIVDCFSGCHIPLSHLQCSEHEHWLLGLTANAHHVYNVC